MTIHITAVSWWIKYMYLYYFCVENYCNENFLENLAIISKIWLSINIYRFYINGFKCFPKYSFLSSAMYQIHAFLMYIFFCCITCSFLLVSIFFFWTLFYWEIPFQICLITSQCKLFNILSMEVHFLWHVFLCLLLCIFNCELCSAEY